jgi:hypothetical protein
VDWLVAGIIRLVELAAEPVDPSPVLHWGSPVGT